MKGESFGQSKFWLVMALDDCTDYAKSVFRKRNSETAQTIVSHAIDLKKRFKRVVKYIRCDE
jgi:hypothetical protein